MAKNIVLKISEKGAKKTVGALKSVGGAVSSIGKGAGLATVGLATLSTKLAGDFQKSLLVLSIFLLLVYPHKRVLYFLQTFLQYPS